jgi:outer membrane protein TolC
MGNVAALRKHNEITRRSLLSMTPIPFLIPILIAAAAVDSAGMLTLPAAVETALRTSPAVLQSQAQRDEAGAARGEARALRLPHVQIREVGVRTDAPADAFGLTLMQERFSLAEFSASDPNQPDPVNNFATEFEATWPIFVGGRVMAGIHQANDMAAAADAGYSHMRESVALATASAYMDAVLAERSVEVARRAHETTARHVSQAQDFFDTGMIVESDLLLARVQLAHMEENVIAAENGARIARARLFQWMGVDQASTYTLDPEVGDMDAPAPTAGDAVAGALQRRNDVHAADARLRAAQSAIGGARGGYWPELALVARYSLNDDRVFGSNGESYALMAVARWNVLDWGQTRSQVGGAKARFVEAEQARRAQVQAVEFEVRQASFMAEEAKKRHDVALGAVGQAERALHIVEDRFAQGVVRISDVLDAETALDDARVRELNARFDAQRSLRTLAFATGLPPVPEVTK